MACHELLGYRLGQASPECVEGRVEWWRRRELNPGPKTFSATDLHV